MKCKTIQVLWHGKDPVLSVDFNPATGQLASCGTDREIKLWRVGRDAEGNPEVTHEDTLTAHTKTVNVVRFSPGGDALASGGDTGEVLLWRPGVGSTNHHGDATSWRQSGVLRGHSDDVFDLAWAPLGVALVTGSVENTCIVWDVAKTKGVFRLEGHAHYVQGVAWDPRGEYLVSQSGDRTVRLFASRGVPHQIASPRWCKNVSCQEILSRGEENADPSAAPGTARSKPGKQALYHDDTMQSFFRRPAWSPCGSFLATPSGTHKEHAGAREQHVTYLFERDKFSRPAVRLPGLSPAVCVRFSPTFYAKKDASGPSTPETTPG